MERHCYEVFPEKGHTTTHRRGFGGAVSVLRFRFDLWLKGDPIRQIRKSFEREEDDEDMPRHSVHYQHARRKAKADLAWAKGHKRSHGRGEVRGPSAPRVASPTPPSTTPALTPAPLRLPSRKRLTPRRTRCPFGNGKRAGAHGRPSTSGGRQQPSPFRARREGRSRRVAYPPRQSRHPLRGRRGSLQEAVRGHSPRTPSPLSHGYLQ